MTSTWMVIAALVAEVGIARADDPATAGGADNAPAMVGKDIVISTPGERSTRNIATLAGVAGAGLVFGAVGLYFHLDSKSAADAVSAKDATSQAWTSDDQATFQRAHESAVKAGVFYGIGGAFVIGAIVALIVTEPKAETTVIHPHGSGTAKLIPTIAPAPGGAVVGGVWSF